jgi:hypothetical protein
MTYAPAAAAPDPCARHPPTHRTKTSTPWPPPTYTAPPGLRLAPDFDDALRHPKSIQHCPALRHPKSNTTLST